jgi:hypothetical protein
MATECTPEQLEFHALGRREIIGRFDGGRITSDGGGLLLRETDLRIGLLSRLAKCFIDHRQPGSVEHSIGTLVSQRVYALALGYEDLNDHDVLRSDSVLALLAGKKDLEGTERVRERDRGRPLAGSSTLNRLELGTPQGAVQDRYKRIVADGEAMDRLLVDVLCEAYRKPPREIWLDLDATDDPLHGHQEGRFFHGYYGHYCYLPLYIFCGEHLLCARLRRSNIDASAGSVEELKRIVGQIRRRWPRVRIIIRGDSGFCREPLMRWCEEQGVGYVLGLARNSRVVRALGRQMHEAKQAHRHTGKPARRFRDFTYRTRRTWSRSRRVIGKAEYLPKGPNPRFVVTNLPTRRAGARRVYEQLYCARGDMENRIKEQQLGLFADRRHHARESAAAVLRLLRLRADARATAARAPRHTVRPSAVHDDPAEAVEDRRSPAHQRTSCVAVIRRSLSLRSRLRSDPRPSAHASTLVRRCVGAYRSDATDGDARRRWPTLRIAQNNKRASKNASSRPQSGSYRLQSATARPGTLLKAAPLFGKQPNQPNR